MIEITAQGEHLVDITLAMPNGDALFNGYIVNRDGDWFLMNDNDDGATVHLGKHANTLAALTAALNHISKD